MIRDVLHRAWTAFRALLAELRRQESVAIVLVTAILVTRHALGEPAGRALLEPLWRVLADLWAPFATGTMQHQLISVTLQLFVPLVVIALVHRRSPRAFGLGAGDLRFWLPLTVVVFAIQAVVVTAYLAGDPIYAARYPTLGEARSGGAVFWAWEGSRVLYMLSWEFLFRGYLLFALTDRLGMLAAVVQMPPFVLMHIVSRKPVSEVYFTIGSGLLSGVFAYENRSVWPVVLLHSAGAVLLDILLVYR